MDQRDFERMMLPVDLAILRTTRRWRACVWGHRIVALALVLAVTGARPAAFVVGAAGAVLSAPLIWQVTGHPEKREISMRVFADAVDPRFR
ncbi:hypothetical protein AB0B31_08960 [Catellatospora citrea]|uniref:hypothetical protein n=1 Tax=Catellatospora citrea TaxID=53366 RepID=UPI0033CC3509